MPPLPPRTAYPAAEFTPEPIAIDTNLNNLRRILEEIADHIECTQDYITGCDLPKRPRINDESIHGIRDKLQYLNEMADNIRDTALEVRNSIRKD